MLNGWIVLVKAKADDKRALMRADVRAALKVLGQDNAQWALKDTYDDARITVGSEREVMEFSDYMTKNNLTFTTLVENLRAKWINSEVK